MSLLLDSLLAQADGTSHSAEAHAAAWQPYAHQIPPDGEPGIDWFIWLLLGGRGAGKTDGCAHFMNQHALGPACLPGPMPHRMAIVAPTLGDASEACVNGPSGLKAHNSNVREVTKKGGTFVKWPNGSEAKLFGAYTKEEPERLRAGGNRCFVWAEELAAWRYLAMCWMHINFGLLRLGKHPHAVISTTPRSRPTVKEVIDLATSTHSITHGTTDDNPSLPEHIRRALYKKYAGTRVGQQELYGELIEDVVGALWNSELIELYRVVEEAVPTLTRLVIAIDPSWGTTNDEVGIVAVGKGSDKHAYVLEDLSGVLTPSEWGKLASEAYDRLGADKVIGEGNRQGEQVRLVMKVAESETGIVVNWGLVYATRGKALRAEPIVALYEQGRVHHVGRDLVGLEHQMTHWVPPQNDEGGGKDTGDPEPAKQTEGDQETSDAPLPSEYSPDRVDALVFAITELLLGAGGPMKTSRATGRIPGTQQRAGDVNGGYLSPVQSRLNRQVRR